MVRALLPYTPSSFRDTKGPDVIRSMLWTAAALGDVVAAEIAMRVQLPLVAKKTYSFNSVSKRSGKDEGGDDPLEETDGTPAAMRLTSGSPAAVRTGWNLIKTTHFFFS